MADQIVLSPNKSASLRRTRSATSHAWTDNWMMAQNEEHLLQGESDNNLQQYASLLQFSLSSIPAGTKIMGAHLHVFSTKDHSGFHNIAPSGTNFRIGPKTASWPSTGGGEAVWTGACPDKVDAYNPTYDVTAVVGSGNLLETSINMMPMVRLWAPKTVLDPAGKACYGKANYGAVLLMAGTDAANKARTVLASDHHQNVGIHPFLVLDVIYKGGPGQTFTSEPNGDIPSGTPLIFKGTYEPGRPGDTIKTVDIKRIATTGYAEKVWTITPSASDIGASSFAVQLPESLPSQTAFTWAARVTTSRSTPSAPDQTPWSAALPVRLTGTPPVLTLSTPVDGATLDSLISVLFKARVNVPIGGFRTERWRIQLREETSPTDPNWGDAVLWDSGLMVVPLTDRGAATAAETQFLQTPYGGPTLDGSTNYSWRAQAIDIFGATSPWKYAGFTLTMPYEPAPGEVVNLTGYAKRPPFRIRIFGMGAKRGPGKLLAELTDAAYVGASEFYNSAGEFFFTLPAIHPQVAVIEPYNAHYALEQHQGDGWVGKAFGLITDFDATEDEVVFYGTDYLGLLARAVEERFDPNDAEKATPTGGKYVKKTITYIVDDQLKKARDMPNSPVGFIAVGAIASMPEKVTIYSSFKQRLPFISGLIDSARSGTGRRTRLVCEKLPNGTFQWRVILEPGVDRKNLRMEYGGLVQGFRTVPFGGWGSSVAAIGRTVLGTKVYSAIAVAPGISETVYGHWPSLTTYSDIDDLADLRRRAAQAAARSAKVGKQMGLGLRVGALGVKDGWDITDALPVSIDRGVVNTTIDPATGVSRWGSGLWTIWGWTWHSFPDGHDALTLSLAPKEDQTGLPTPGDLIESQPILVDWQVGHGTPTTWGVPPTPAPASFMVTEEDGPEVDAMAEVTPYTGEVTTDGVVAKNYQDMDTGCLYALNETTDVYELVSCPDGGGGGTPYVPDTVPPTAPAILDATSGLEAQDDGTFVVGIAAQVGWAVTPVGLTDLAEILMQSTRFELTPGVPDWTRSTEWTTQVEDPTGATPTIVIQPGVQAATPYWLRAAARDKSGNLSGWSNIWPITSGEDAVGPPPPQNMVTVPGNTTFAVRWDGIGVADLAYVEVQWKKAADATWSETARVPGTMTVIAGVANEVLYNVRLRSVDTSGNVGAGKATDPDLGWVSAPNVTPSKTPAASIAWEEGDFETIFAGNINADWITTGTLRVGNVPRDPVTHKIVPVPPDTLDADNVAVFIYDTGGRIVGMWTAPTVDYAGGIEVMRPGSPYRLVITDSSLRILDLTDPDHPIATVTIQPLGIDAASITFGSARGGHNLIQNSSFEMGQFVTGGNTPNTWDVKADWDATRAIADTNLNANPNDLSMTTVV